MRYWTTLEVGGIQGGKVDEVGRRDDGRVRDEEDRRMNGRRMDG
jgi:hypothetical protein